MIRRTFAIARRPTAARGRGRRGRSPTRLRCLLEREKPCSYGAANLHDASPLCARVRITHRRGRRGLQRGHEQAARRRAQSITPRRNLRLLSCERAEREVHTSRTRAGNVPAPTWECPRADVRMSRCRGANVRVATFECLPRDVETSPREVGMSRRGGRKRPGQTFRPPRGDIPRSPRWTERCLSPRRKHPRQRISSRAPQGWPSACRYTKQKAACVEPRRRQLFASTARTPPPARPPPTTF